MYIHFLVALGVVGGYMLAKQEKRLYGQQGLIQRVHIRTHERGILLKDGDFQRILEPGRFWLMNLGARYSVETYDLTKPEFESKYATYVLKQQPQLAETYWQVVDLLDHEVGLIYLDGKLSTVLPPQSRKFYWKGLADITVKRVDVSQTAEVSPELRDTLMSAPQVQNHVVFHELQDYETGMVFVNGKLEKTLSAGLHAFWRYGRSTQVKVVDTRLQTLEVNGQEILTKDKVSLRLNLSANYQIQDAQTVVLKLQDAKEFLYRELQFALRAAVGELTLDELLQQKEKLGTELLQLVQSKVNEYGLVLQETGIKDIILPGEMRDIMNQVVEAEKVAQANLIRRREETAATRSLMNTAKLLESNPLLLRLKELESLEKLSGKISNLSVYGGLEGLVIDLVKLKD